MVQNKNSRKSEGICDKIRNIFVSPFRTSTNQPHNLLHQSSMISQTVPVDYNHVSSQNSKKSRRERENTLANEREKVVDKPNNARLAKARSKVDDDSILDQEGKFSDFISKTKNRMMKTLSTVGGGGGGSGGSGGGGVPSRRDSFNDKVTNFIDRAKIKIRTTSNVVDK